MTVIALLLTVTVGQVARAETRNYQYDGNMPFVKMMLSMMVAMGIIDRVPGNGRYGGYSPQSRWSGFNSPLQRSPWMNSPWLNSPNGYSSGPGRFGSAWGNPGWGVLPVESYSPYSYSGNNYASNDLPWSSSELSGWVDEPWESSVWNSKAQDVNRIQPSSPQQPNSQRSDRASQNNVNNELNHVVNNPPQNTGQPGSGRQYQGQQNNQQLNKNRNPNQSSRSRSPLSRLVQPTQQSAQQPLQQSWQQNAQGNTRPQANTRPQGRPSYRSSSRPAPGNIKPGNIKQRPCITEFCGLKKPNINGFWVTQNGEMLGVKNNQFLWNDGSSRYLSGLMKIENEYLVFSVEGSKQLLHFKYKISGNHLLTMQPDGKIRDFVRMSKDGYFY